MAGTKPFGNGSRSPYFKPNDKDVFLARDNEKAKRTEQREKHKGLKIWDKKTASTRQPLKKFRDADIPSASDAAPLIPYGRATQNLITEAKKIYNSRVQFNKDGRG